MTSILSKMASAVGDPFFTDNCTMKRERISYARIGFLKVKLTKQHTKFSETSRTEWNVFQTKYHFKMAYKKLQ